MNTPVAETIRPSNNRQIILPPDIRDLTDAELNGLNLRGQRLETLQGEIARLQQQIAIYGEGVSSFDEQLRVAIGARDRLLNEITGITNSQVIPRSINALDINLTGNGGVDDNALNPYIDVVYHVLFTMLPQNRATEFQTGGFNQVGTSVDLNTLRSSNLRDDGTITFASTADAFSNDREINNYYNIESLVVKNITEPSTTNPMIATMLNMKMRIAEPHGMKLHEDIREAAGALGYFNVNPGRILYRVDIYFSGYTDEGQWVEQIPLGQGINTISSVMSISSMEAEVTNAGTFYDIDMVPAGHHAYRPEDFILDANAFNSGATLRDFLTSLSTALYEAKFQRTNEQLIRNYEFFAPAALMDSQFDVDEFFNQFQHIFRQNDPSHTLSTGRGVDIMTLLRGALANTQVAQELFIADAGNDAFLTPRVLFTLRFNTIYGGPTGGPVAEADLNDYPEITHQYLIEPYITFKHGPVTRDNVFTYVEPGSQISRVRELINFGQLRRIYNYIYTAENTEVIDFDIKLRAFFYNTLNTASTTNATGRGAFTGAANDALAEITAIQSSFGTTGGGTNADATIQRLFGGSTPAASGPSRLTGPDRLGGGFNETADADLYGDMTSDPNGRRLDYELYMDDYLSLDLLKLEGLVIRGDPTWLLSPYANVDVQGLGPLASTEGVSSGGVGNNVQVRPRQGQVIFLKIRVPNQDDHMNPNRTSGTSYPNIIGGFYQVTAVTSTFQGGKFTQSVEGVKLNHLNYVEEEFAAGGSPPTGAGAGSPLTS